MVRNGKVNFLEFNKMRIFQIINHFGLDRGGAERIALKLHNELRGRGVDARLVALENCSTTGLEGATTLGFASPYDPGVFRALMKFLRQTLRPGDVIHGHLFPTSAYIAFGKKTKRFDVRCVFTEHNTHNKRRNKLFGGFIDRAIYKEFNEIIAVSDGTKESLVASYPPLAKKTKVIPNGVSLVFDRSLSRAPKKCPTILSVGRLVPQKNFDSALIALAEIENLSFEYIVLGEGGERSNLEKLTKKLGLCNRVSFKGYVSYIEPYLETADIFLIPSRWEGFGLAAVEAMNASLPVIASDVPGLREVIGDCGETGLLVSPNSTIEISRALKLLINQDDLRSRMGLNGFIRAQRFTQKNMVDSYLDTFRDQYSVIS